MTKLLVQNFEIVGLKNGKKCCINCLFFWINVSQNLSWCVPPKLADQASRYLTSIKTDIWIISEILIFLVDGVIFMESLIELDIELH